MPITYPIPLADFTDLLQVSGGTFQLSESRRLSVSGRGEVITTAGGFRRWEGSIKLTPLKNADAGAVDTLLDVLTETGATALLYDHRRPYPMMDPKGLILGSLSPVIASVNVNMKEMTLSGLPANYILSRGDYLAFTYLDAASLLQYSLHRIVSLSTTSSSTGVTPSFEVRPHLPEDITMVGLAVTLKKPSCKVVLKPGAVTRSMGQPGMVSEGPTFDFVQARR